jgi:hypothetical protein
MQRPESANFRCGPSPSQLAHTGEWSEYPIHDRGAALFPLLSTLSSDFSFSRNSSANPLEIQTRVSDRHQSTHSHSLSENLWEDYKAREKDAGHDQGLGPKFSFLGAEHGELKLPPPRSALKSSRNNPCDEEERHTVHFAEPPWEAFPTSFARLPHTDSVYSYEDGDLELAQVIGVLPAGSTGP